MKETDDWQGIPSRLRAAGFTVSYIRISYQPKNLLWRANAIGNGREWSTLGRDLQTTLLQLEEQTQAIMPDWRVHVSPDGTAHAKEILARAELETVGHHQ